MKIIIAAIKLWNVKNADKFRRDNDYEHDVFIITNKDDLIYEKVSEINPEYIFSLIGSGLFQNKYIKLLIV